MIKCRFDEMPLRGSRRGKRATYLLDRGTKVLLVTSRIDVVPPQKVRFGHSKIWQQLRRGDNDAGPLAHEIRFQESYL